MDLKQLNYQWQKEKEFYTRQELGSGVHSFVKNCLESEKLFKLKAGSLSTKIELRKNEFIHEKTAKEKRRADFVIYIDTDIVIPLEVEKYLNIKAGIKQLQNYQKDFDKQYGILTDGWSWRFYNNNIYRVFTLGQILNETDVFIEFWKEYIKPEFYYLSFFEPQGQLLLLNDSEILPVDKNRLLFFQDITNLIKSLKSKLNIEGYLRDLTTREKEKKLVEITYAYIIQFILYKVLVDNEFDDFKQAFESRNNAIYECLKAKQYGKILGIIEGISNTISENIYRPFVKEQQFISKTILNLICQPKNELSDVSPWLDIFVFIKKYNFANLENEIFGYIYENYLKELYEEGQKGQYFTDPSVVNFMLQQIGYIPENIKKRYGCNKNSISLCDPSCGSGTFLYSAVNQIVKVFGDHSKEKSQHVEKIINENIFGLDIAEFPLYLAEMNILMRLLPQIITEKYNNPIDKKIKLFLTRDSVAEFINAGLKNTYNDIVVANGSQSLFDASKLDFEYKSFMREGGDIKEMKKGMRHPRRLFDFVIGNPPYIGYNECSRQKILIFDLMKKGEAKLNDIYGVNLHSVPINRKKYRPNPNLYAFFVALGLALLKDTGKLCYIIPQTILTAGDLDVLRWHLAKFTTIDKIITFGGKMFIGRGLKQNKPVATSSLIIVASKATPLATHKVEIINYKSANDSIEKTLQNILSDKKAKIKTILQGKLLNNIASWNFIKEDKAFLDFYDGYKQNSQSIAIYYDHMLAQNKFGSKFYFDGGYNIDERRILADPLDKKFNYLYPKFDNNLYTIKKNIGYWANNRGNNTSIQIGLRQGNQGYNLLDSPHKILWSYANPKRFHFSSLPLIWARNQICAIGSKNKKELLYLFSILNSSLIHKVICAVLKNENEKDLLLSLSSIKQFVRAPKITEFNQHIKTEIIKQADIMLCMEEKKLSDCVNFSGILMQKFDTLVINSGELNLISGEKQISRSIKNADRILVSKIIDYALEQKTLFGNNKKISLDDLENLPVIDFDQQRQIKDYVDDLVFVLYFNVVLKNIGIKNASSIKFQCWKNKFYKIANS
ncbi:hypothetical protein CO101_00595 [Candidatus Berkelbacteria bacterium CG_4_9_14_3_um_filter_39_23]|uniref:site-specific DNA-methyltransferase (adenine-specific) n=2 Tax=Candidatus Berkelbacteria TaxID=1618330 RepID=A0A2M7CIQ6_9BACT|nr:MAG: hypothetical protein AUK14_02460 [Candidatus Berkelbacteria bacterium CG2_30_39_44]PIR27957.1 MAG: hypothetical protein COV39_01700 [Candidatus Berkelbacteria bacterium CG11_big_fil_rev_8_21_14_0_20_40_23]PIV25515.1 MAG: hypothetical protein COS38_01205 [Candidatus Berkelbacteria bacterium CG03_land_8_20_14_0_80_40_36]PIX30644.1 MAG: hypothetical protein COZ62_01535 [Candidatus Berkelbacteria bacterium CG_4_8_14_3_um_filter_39_27]PIZ28776.1 MAG: hypothetical protein COY44_02375 [Candida